MLPDHTHPNLQVWRRSWQISLLYLLSRGRRIEVVPVLVWIEVRRVSHSFVFVIKVFWMIVKCEQHFRKSKPFSILSNISCRNLKEVEEVYYQLNHFIYPSKWQQMQCKIDEFNFSFFHQNHNQNCARRPSNSETWA